jgi:peptide/nickel transport system ATP-binding protein
MSNQPAVGAPLLDIRNATKAYGAGPTANVALQNFSLRIAGSPAKIVTIAGESGSGKSTLAGIALGYVGLTSGQVLFKGRDIAAFSRSERRDFYHDCQAIFQDPYAVFNPFYKLSHAFRMTVRNFRVGKNRAEADARVEDALVTVGLRPDRVLDRYSYQLSGGQLQRALIARAYLLNAELIIADEPVSMLDASLRGSILGLIQKMRDEKGVSFVYITHDLSTGYLIGDETYVLYRGRIVEHGTNREVFEDPEHPYVRQLIASIPHLDVPWDDTIEIPDAALAGTAHVTGCAFSGRCPSRMDRCTTAPPRLLTPRGNRHPVACYLYDEAERLTPAIPGDEVP